MIRAFRVPAMANQREPENRPIASGSKPCRLQPQPGSFGNGARSGIEAEKIRCTSYQRQSWMKQQQWRRRRLAMLSVPRHCEPQRGVPISGTKFKDSLGKILVPKPLASGSAELMLGVMRALHQFQKIL